jgi:anaerobic magnesium-protoporphyrin IX monomethyl ester cyclase
VSVSYPLPGTKFHELVKAQLGRKTHWHESNDLDMMFQGTYKSNFYRSVRDLLHDQILEQTDIAGLEAHGTSHNPAALGARSLERRWHELIDSEAQYRSPDGRSAASG